MWMKNNSFLFALSDVFTAFMQQKYNRVQFEFSDYGNNLSNLTTIKIVVHILDHCLIILSKQSSKKHLVLLVKK